MEPNIEEWKRLTAQELMDKKDSIEEEIKSLHEELENVRLRTFLNSGTIDRGLYAYGEPRPRWI